MPIDLPILQHSDGVSAPMDGICLGCGKSFGNSLGDDQVSIQGGAFPVGGIYGKAFLSLVVIQERDRRQHIFEERIVDQLIGGQFMIFWCSLECMRKALNEWVDRLQSRILK